MLEMDDTAGDIDLKQKKYTTKDEVRAYKNALWYRVDTATIFDLTTTVPNKSLSIKRTGPKVLHPGDEFRLMCKTDKVRYPYIQLMVPPNMVVVGSEFQHHTWPFPSRNLQVPCKAIHRGMGTFYVLLQDRYRPEGLHIGRYPVVVV